MTELLSDKVAVVTGGSNGIGRAISRTFAEHGADVVVADIVETPYEREGDLPTHEYINEHTDAEAQFVQCDVSNTDDLEAAVAAADEFGGITTMVNNAGMLAAEELFDFDESEFDRLLGVHVKGTYYGTSIAAEQMVETGQEGSIINLSSVAGILGLGTSIGYCTVKGAIRIMTYAWADALGEFGIRANALHPGVIETHFTVGNADISPEETERYGKLIDGTPLGRSGQPTDIANAALYLASDLASFVTGESLIVDGGMTTTHKL